MLGDNFHISAFLCKGNLDNPESDELINSLMKTIKMKSGGDTALWTYPNITGGGGVGFTLVKPIVESFMGAVAIDTWKDHEHFLLFVVSCKKYSVERVERFLLKRFEKIAGLSFVLKKSMLKGN